MIKLVLAILLSGLLVPVHAYGQGDGEDMRPPFRVLIAKHAFRQSGDSLKSLDNVFDNDVITIRQGGSVSLIHFTGFPIELSTDSVVNIHSVHAAILATGVPKTMDYSKVPALELLFIRDETEWRIKRPHMYYEVVGHAPEFMILYPPIISGQLLFQDELCLKWKTRRGGPYKISATTLFDEPLGSWTVNGDSLYISPEEIRQKFSGESSIMLYIGGGSGGKTPLSLRKLNAGPVYPIRCTVMNATAALMTGCYIEILDDRTCFPEAEKYYLMASTLSENDFFKQMLQNFYDRHKNLKKSRRN